MKLGLLNKGDKVINVTETMVAIQRKNGDVDIIPILFPENEIPRIDTEKIITITYGCNTVEMTYNNDSDEEITITTF